MTAVLTDLAREVGRLGPVVAQVRDEVGKVVVGQTALIDRLILALVADGHVLIEGIPGIAKTTAVRALARAVDCQMSRLQFTPDLLPADLVGTEVYRPQTGEFAIRKGPVFAQLVLADEINRAPAKVQSALLEAMAERQVTLGEQSFALPEPFIVLATQNPIEQEGTYPLPEAQLDRFLLKVRLGYPDRADEKEVMRRMARRQWPTSGPVLDLATLRLARELAESIYLDAKVEDYIIDIVQATRSPEGAKLGHLAPLIHFGASPRGTIGLARVARAHALVAGRAYVTPQDVKSIAPDVLRHRLLMTYEAEARGATADGIVAEVLNTLDVP